WFLHQQLELPGVDVQGLLQPVYDLLVQSALEQPSVLVHRDYHSRNLMVLDSGALGVIDFQDAVMGPVTYDLVSLLKDCYHKLPLSLIDSLLAEFQSKSVVLKNETASQLRRWFDLMGLQRHLKVAGIFSRLNLRDGKPRYLKDIPLVMTYIREVTSQYPEFSDFDAWLDSEVMPQLASELFQR
ncbi:MAG: phosphotransferase, partial [Pseudomonadales bacterium]|nr:phosphotransferase [Pseudomonadales bacterium]